MHLAPRSFTISLADRIATTSVASLSAAGAAVIGLPLLGILAAPPLGDLALVTVSLLGGAGVAAAGWWRQSLLSLPLELSKTGLQDLLGGHPVYRFRVRLGRNRMATEVRIDVHFEGEKTLVPLQPVVSALPSVVGPWTVVVVDRDRTCEGPGRFVVRVRAQEGERVWEVGAQYERSELLTGRFGADLRVEGERLVVDPDQWSAIMPSQAA